MVGRGDKQQGESFVTTYEDELKDVAKAVGSGKLADIAGSAAAFFVKWTTGSSIAAAFAEATVEKVAALFGQWLLEQKPELEKAACAYGEAATPASERVALELYMLQRTETMYASTRLVLMRHGYAAQEPGLEGRAHVERLASALEIMLPTEQEHRQLADMLQSAAQQRKGRSSRLADRRAKALEARRLERAVVSNPERDKDKLAAFVREHERVLERQASWQFQSPWQVSRSVLLEEPPREEERHEERRGTTSAKHRARQRERS